MLTKLTEKIKAEFSKERAFDHVIEISQHHRIQASPGFRHSADYCLKAWQKAGLQSEILSYAGDGKTTYWGNLMPQEWSCCKGELSLVAPSQQKLASFADVPISIIQRSAGTPSGGVNADLVVLDKGSDELAYEDLDLRDKIVLTGDDVNKVRAWAVEKKGALGIITDRIAEYPPIRHRYDMGDAVQYTSFWWFGDEKKCFGFVLSPKAGHDLRQLAAKEAQEGRHLRVQAEVVASFYAGHIENVTALIPGQTSEEVVVVAHLCHPQPSANDNASGAGLAIEVARTLNTLIEEGKLPQPKRSIRFLLVPEMTGTYAYLASNEDMIEKMVAGVNLDMVGQNQELCKGPLLVEKPPHACLSFAGDLMEAVLEEVAKEALNLAGTSRYGLFKYAVTPFSGGSDHYILSDPTVGIGCPMLIQWPDMFYHTSFDTIDKVDPQMLYRVGVMTAVYSYYIAQAGAQEAWDIGLKILQVFSGEAQKSVVQRQQVIRAGLDKGHTEEASQAIEQGFKHMDYLQWLKSEELKSLQRLADDFNPLLSKLLTMLKDRHATLIQQWQTMVEVVTLGHEIPAFVETPNKWREQARQLIPSRLQRGPIGMRESMRKLSDKRRQEFQELSEQHGKAARLLPTYIAYWMDGERSLAEIGNKIEHEVGNVDWEFMVRYLDFLQELNFVKVVSL